MRVLKYVYVARRLTGLSPAQFVTRWRQHALLSMYFPGWEHIERYEQCDVVRDDGDTPADGVAVIRYLGAFARSDDPAALEIRARDELELFGERVSNFAALFEEVAARGVMGAPLRAFVFGSASAGAERADLYGRAADGAAGVLGSTFNVMRPHVYTSRSRLKYREMVELSLDPAAGEAVHVRAVWGIKQALGLSRAILSSPRRMFDRSNGFDERAVMRQRAAHDG